MSEPRPSSPQSDEHVLDDRPPVLGSWRAIYAVVLGNLAVLVALFWLLTEVYG